MSYRQNVISTWYRHHGGVFLENIGLRNQTREEVDASGRNGLGLHKDLTTTGGNDCRCEQ
jgi:hypothetical protein